MWGANFIRLSLDRKQWCLLTRWWTFGLHEMKGIYWQAERPLALRKFCAEWTASASALEGCLLRVQVYYSTCLQVYYSKSLFKFNVPNLCTVLCSIQYVCWHAAMLIMFEFTFLHIPYKLRNVASINYVFIIYQFLCRWYLCYDAPLCHAS